jgi:hypothetical protein
MSNVIRFLEKMGSEAHWGEAPWHELEAALTEAKVEGPLRTAILDRDSARLQALLQQPRFFSTVIPAVPEEEEEGGDEEEPGQHPEPTDLRAP